MVPLARKVPPAQKELVFTCRGRTKLSEKR